VTEANCILATRRRNFSTVRIETQGSFYPLRIFSTVPVYAHIHTAYTHTHGVQQAVAEHVVEPQVVLRAGYTQRRP